MNVNEKIQQLESDLRHIQSELDMLKEYVHTSNIETPVQNNSIPPKREIPSQPASKENMSFEQNPTDIPVQKPSTNLENLFGKYIMGIAASVLIFIGLIFFGILIYRNFTETLKMITIYTFSSALLFSGCILLKRKKNAFHLSLTGCGLGAFYISFIVTYIYFHRFNYITLYILLFLWAVAVIVLAGHYQSDILTIIGQLGILIASIFGLTIANDQSITVILLTFFIVLGTGLFLVANQKGQKPYMLAFLSISDSLLLFITAITKCDTLSIAKDTAWNLSSTILIIYALFLFAYLLRKSGITDDLYNVAFSISTFFLVLTTIIFVSGIQLEKYIRNDVKMTLLLVWLFGWWLLANFRKIAKVPRIILFAILFPIMVLCYHSDVEVLYEYLGFSVFYLPCLLYGAWKKDKLYTIGSYCILGFQLIYIFSLPKNYLPITCIIAATLLIAGLLIYFDKESYSVRKKLLHYCYCIAFFFLICLKLSFLLFEYDIAFVWYNLIQFALGSVLTMAMLYGGWCKNPVTGEKEDKTFTFLSRVNLFLLADGIKICYSKDISTGLQFVLILWLTILCAAGFKHFIAKKGLQKGSVILAIKYTIYVIFILHSFTIHVQTLTSIVCLLIAIACILLGFKLESKYLRVYGLVLTMLAVAKLLLIDISYNDSVARMISFFICGALCFAINYIYNIAVKKYDK